MGNPTTGTTAGTLHVERGTRLVGAGTRKEVGLVVRSSTAQEWSAPCRTYPSPPLG